MIMITDEIQLRPRYGEVDQMGYVYHANYVSYCHQARTELLRKMGIHDSLLEENNVMLPVISFEINYKKPAHYDELLTIKTKIKDMPEVRFNFEFEVWNEEGILLTTAKSTVVFVDSKNRFPMGAPDFVEKALENAKTMNVCN
jgi:acyl-CoA thioester hydrolase